MQKSYFRLHLCAQCTRPGKIESVGPVEIMDVKVEGLPPNTDFDFFVIQIPHAPFGLAWYQGDIETNRYGSAMERSSGASVSRLSSLRPPALPAPARVQRRTVSGRRVESPD